MSGVIGSLRVTMCEIIRIVTHENRERNGLPGNLAREFDALTTAVETLKKDQGLLGAVRVAQALSLHRQARRFYGDLITLPFTTH